MKTTMTVVALFVISAALSAAAAKPRVFVSGQDSDGGSTASETTGHLVKACPGLTVTIDRDTADFIVVRDYTGAGPGRKPQKVTVFNRDHDLIFSGADRSIAGAAKDACAAIKGQKR